MTTEQSNLLKQDTKELIELLESLSEEDRREIRGIIVGMNLKIDGVKSRKEKR